VGAYASRKKLTKVEREDLRVIVDRVKSQSSEILKALLPTVTNKTYDVVFDLMKKFREI
jgi:type IV pilus biogenesis protein CpaD/CtpE